MMKDSLIDLHDKDVEYLNTGVSRVRHCVSNFIPNCKIRENFRVAVDLLDCPVNCFHQSDIVVTHFGVGV